MRNDKMRGDESVVHKKDEPMARAFDLLAGLPDDFELANREKDLPQKRKSCDGTVHR
jgi:hypothetical protein